MRRPRAGSGALRRRHLIASSAMLLAAAHLAHSRSAHATPAALFGAGPQSQALAGTGSSYASGDTQAYLNPAGLSRDAHKTFSFGLHAARFALDASGEPLPNLDDLTQALLFGVTVPLPLPEPVADRLVLGLAISAPGDAIARVSILNETRPQFPLLAPRADALNFNLGLGARLPWGLRVGVGTGLLASLRGTIALSASGAAAQSVTDDELVLTAAPTLGLAYEPSPALGFAVVLRSALRSAFDLNVTVDNLGQLVVPKLHVTGLAGFDPAELNLETSYVFGSWRAVAGLGYKAWAALEALREPTISCSIEAPNCQALGAPDLQLHDTLVPRIALSHGHALTRNSYQDLRAGYFFEPSPIPAQHEGYRVFDNPRHVLTAGYALTTKAPLPSLQVQLAVQWHMLTLRKHEVGAETGAHTLTTKGSIASLCWTLGGEF